MVEISPLVNPCEGETTPFFEARIKVGLQKYVQRELWSLWNASTLVHLIDPECPSFVESVTFEESDYIPESIDRIYTLCRADAGERLKTTKKHDHHYVKPADFIAWLGSRGIAPPPLFLEIFAHADNRAMSRQAQRKQETKERHYKWNAHYRQLLKINPHLSKSDAARQISKLDIAEGRTYHTIRKNLK